MTVTSHRTQRLRGFKMVHNKCDVHVYWEVPIQSLYINVAPEFYVYHCVLLKKA